MQILELRNAIRDYAWGSTSLLSELLGIPNPEAGPQAELWMGAHPGAPSQVEIAGRWISLADCIASKPAETLGPDVDARFGGELPFLMKVLAAAEPLSLQVHPNVAQAQAGFLRENEAGIALQAPDRSYRDSRPKPELMCALTKFDALLGFRSPEEICANLEPLGSSALEAPLARLGVSGVEPSEALRGFFGALLQLDPRAASELAREATAHCSGRASASPAHRWVGRLAELYPGDALVIAPLLLNLVSLQPGEAIFLQAGVLHSYLGGCGVEIMANSDNVLRGGLTVKHIDTRALLDVLTFDCDRPQIRRPRPISETEEIYETPAAEFELSIIELARDRSFRAPEARGVEILLCVSGRVEASPTAGGAALRLERGVAAFVPASLGGYQLRGEGRVFRASVPR